MIKKILLLFTLISFFQINAQVLYNYPKDQDFYEGGKKGLFSEMQKIVVKIILNLAKKRKHYL